MSSISLARLSLDKFERNPPAPSRPLLPEYDPRRHHETLVNVKAGRRRLRSPQLHPHEACTAQGADDAKTTAGEQGTQDTDRAARDHNLVSGFGTPASAEDLHLNYLGDHEVRESTAQLSSRSVEMVAVGSILRAPATILFTNGAGTR